MEAKFDSALLEKFRKEAKLKIQGSDAPQTHWTVITNMWGNGSVMIYPPQSGNLWVWYWPDPYAKGETQMAINRSDGTMTPIPAGESVIPIYEDDAIYYQLYDPTSDAIQLFYQLI